MASQTIHSVAALLARLKYIIIKVLADRAATRDDMESAQLLLDRVDAVERIRKATADAARMYPDLPPDVVEEIEGKLASLGSRDRGFLVFLTRERKRRIDFILNTEESLTNEEVAYLVSAFGIETTPQHVRARRRARIRELQRQEGTAEPKRRKSRGQRGRKRSTTYRKSTPQEKDAIRGLVRGGLTDAIEIKNALTMSTFPDVTLPSIRRIVADELKRGPAVESDRQEDGGEKRPEAAVAVAPARDDTDDSY